MNFIYGDRFGVLNDPDFTTASNLWVLPSGPVPIPGSDGGGVAGWSAVAFPLSRRCDGIFSSPEAAPAEVVESVDSVEPGASSFAPAALAALASSALA